MYDTIFSIIRITRYNICVCFSTTLKECKLTPHTMYSLSAGIPKLVHKFCPHLNISDFPGSTQIIIYFAKRKISFSLFYT
jgi:hypothetical protein